MKIDKRRKRGLFRVEVFATHPAYPDGVWTAMTAWVDEVTARRWKRDFYPPDARVRSYEDLRAERITARKAAR